MADAQSHVNGLGAQSNPNVQSPEVITINTQFSPGELGGSQFATPIRDPGSQILIASSPSHESSASPLSSRDSSGSARPVELSALQPDNDDDGEFPGRKHTRRNTKANDASGSKRLKLDGSEDVSMGGKVGVATLLNPEEPEEDRDCGAKSRILFKCAVCLDMPDPAVFVHPCGHVFCEVCAQGAIQTTMRCPVCRHSMRVNNIRVLQFRVAKVGR
ncbi:hypothetical protein GGF43_006280 [Coemansia sp. RSA 2618]|nr:hypothetical protein GGF43_006280 [Coemansia sp. RSA 2618]